MARRIDLSLARRRVPIAQVSLFRSTELEVGEFKSDEFDCSLEVADAARSLAQKGATLAQSRSELETDGSL